MSQNSIFIGLVLVSPISNQKRYEAVLNEILSYLSTKTQDINVQIKPNRFITFFSINGNICDQVCLPLSPLYLHTSYFRLHQGYQLTVEDKRFAAISWEVLNILKENFPSKIYLHQENLELCSDYGQSGFYSPMSQNEELRRQISCLLSLREEGKPLTIDELEDVWHTLQFSEKIGDSKSQNTCLELIQQGAPLQMICAIKNQIDIETLKRIAEKGDYTQLSSNKIIAIDLLNKIENLDNSKMLINGQDTLQKQLNELNQCDDDSMSSMGGNDTQGPQSNNPTLERPTSTRMCLFQLSESNDLNRVTLILDTLSMRSKETLSQMKKKYNLNSKLVSILKKYCNGDYGFDQQSSRHGHFQLNLLKLLIVLSSDYAVYLEYLQSQAIDFLCQIIEEGVIFAYEDALAGDQVSGQVPQNEKLYKFLSGALDVIEMAVSKQFNEYVPAIKDNLVKILQRIGKLMSKKENALLNYFIQQYSTAGTTTQYGTNQNVILTDGILNYEEQMGTTNTMNQTINTHIQVEQMHELKAVSEGLYYFTVKLQDQVQRIEALQDFNEHYEEKHRRLFYKVMGIYQQKNEGSRLENYQMEAVCESNNDVSKDRYQKKVSSTKVQFRGGPSHRQQYDNSEEDRYYEHKQVTQQKEKPSYVNDDSHEYRAKVQSKKKVETNQDCYIANKENEPHYIGSSPIQPYRKPGSSKRNDEDYISNNNFKRNNLSLK